MIGKTGEYSMNKAAEPISGYIYGAAGVAASPVSNLESQDLKPSVGFNQDRINYQQDIAARHTSVKKNRVDAVSSTAGAPLRDIIAFLAVINNTIKPYLAAKGDLVEEVDKMHRAWCKSTQLQLELWAKPYTEARHGLNEW
jgi:hypothetical protein